MKILFLDGGQATDTIARSMQTVLTDELQRRNAEVEYIRPAEKHIGPCMGDFFCWVRSPGLCIQTDDNRAIAQAYLQSDLVVLLTPITFGGYSSELKRAVDHLIQLVLPFFAQVEGETHHQRRYRHYPRLLAIGWLPEPDKPSEDTFHHLVYRNAINFHAPSAFSAILHAAQNSDEIRHMARGWIHAVLTGEGYSQVSLPTSETQPDTGGGVPKRALLLVGSPRGKHSTSQALGGYLFQRMTACGIQSETIRLYTVLKSEEGQRALIHAVSAADLVTLAFPLYVDSLPAPVTRVLEMIAESRRGREELRPQRFAALVNCGFPEAAQNQTALAICQNFARQAGFEWSGGLALGAGQGIVHGVPLDELAWRANSLRHALDMTADAFAAGQPIPREAVGLMAAPIIPGWLYRLLGVFGWRRQAALYHAQSRLKAQPYEQSERVDSQPSTESWTRSIGK